MALLLKEHDIQRAYFDWARRHPVARRAYAVPNAAKRSPRLAAMMVAEGLRKGVLDIHLPVARGTCHGLFIEFKAGSNKLTPEQDAECQALVADGFFVVVAWDTVLAIEATVDYLSGVLAPELRIIKSQPHKHI